MTSVSKNLLDFHNTINYNFNNDMKNVILHGEAMIFKSILPEDVTKLKPTNESYHISADSETTGNHHVVDHNEKVEFYMDENGTMFMINEEPTQVRCLHENRHDTIPLETGCWEFGIQEEYDHFAEALRKVRD
jgi:hypothetical protein